MRAQARNDDVAGYVSSGYTYIRVSSLFKVQAYNLMLFWLVMAEVGKIASKVGFALGCYQAKWLLPSKLISRRTQRNGKSR